MFISMLHLSRDFTMYLFRFHISPLSSSPEKIYDKLPKAKEEEEDLLDLAYGLTETSRLGCQVIVDESFNNTIITLPKATRNFYAPKI